MTGETVSSGQATLPSTKSTVSFWHSQPSIRLIGHRTTEHLPQTADVVIIGSGITGAFAAHNLADEEGGKGLNVVMLEAREACWGATGRNGGHCKPNLSSNPPHIGRFELDNFHNIHALITENHIDCEWQDVEGCHAYTSSTLFDAHVAEVNLLRSLDPELGNLVTVVNSRSMNPSLTDLKLGDEIVGAIVMERAASLWPYKLVACILERLLSIGGTESGTFNLQTTTPVTRLQKSRDSTWELHTHRGMMVAKEVILATNAYTSYLLPEFTNLITPVRGQMGALIPPNSLRPGCGNPFVGKYSYGFYGRGTGKGETFNQDDYLIQRPFRGMDMKETGNELGGELMFGGGRQYANGYGVGVSDDGEIDEPVARYLRRELIQVLDLPKGEVELCASYEWTGIIGLSKDDRPWVGEVPETLGGGRGLRVSAGFTGHGMPNASLCAKAVVEMMMGKRVEEVNLPVELRLSARRIEMARVLVKPLVPGITLGE
ncbi:unnamed protein product [Calypogeia fissa]